MSSILVKGSMGLRAGQILQRLDRRDVEAADWIGIEKSGGYKVLKARHGVEGLVREIPEYAGTPKVVRL